MKTQIQMINLKIIEKMKEKPSQAKANRHQLAKEKEFFYQRSLSYKKSLTTGNSYVPLPGKFAVEKSIMKEKKEEEIEEERKVSSQAQIRFTSNIKTILKEKNVSPAAEVLCEVVNKKVQAEEGRIRIKGRGGMEFKRPISAKIYEDIGNKSIEESIMVRNAVEYDKIEQKKAVSMKKTTFQVRSRTNMPKHIHGYNIIKINEKYSEQPESQKFLKFSSINIEQETKPTEEQIQSKNFLPIEYYLAEEIIPEKLMEMYRNDEGIIMGYSRWFNVEGNFVWKRCQVLGFNDEKQRWVIEWLHNGAKKMVARNNLHFEEEDKKSFEEMVEKAELSRQRNETFMKYNMLVDLVNTPVEKLPQEKIVRIRKYVTVDREKKQNYDNVLKKLEKQAEKMYIRACHQVEFNSKLPFNEEYKKVFSNFLPKQLFSHPPLPTKWPTKNIHSSPGVRELFSSGLEKIKKNYLLNNTKKLQILNILNKLNEQLDSHSLLRTYSTHTKKQYPPHLFNQILLSNTTQYFYKIRCRIGDVESHVSQEMDPIYAQRKKFTEESYQEIINNCYRFLGVLNMRLEDILRNSLLQKVKQLINILCLPDNMQTFDQLISEPFEKTLSMNLLLKMSIKEGQVETSPALPTIKEYFINFKNTYISEFTNLKCVHKSYIKQVRPNNTLAIIAKNTISYQSQMLQNTLNSFSENLENIFKALDTFVKGIESMQKQIKDMVSEGTKKIHKKFLFVDAEETVKKIKAFLDKVQLMFLNGEVRIGIFSFDVKQIKEKWIQKINSMSKDISRLIIQRITKDNEKLEKSLEVILSTLTNQPKTLEQLSELQQYTYVTLPQELEKLQTQKFHTTIEKLDLLEPLQQAPSYKQFESCWGVYVKPLKIRRVRQETVFRIENVYRKNFGEELMKEAYVIIDNVKACEKIFRELLQKKNLKQMDESFHLYSKLNDDITSNYQQMLSINCKQKSLKWTQTNFQKLVELKKEFQPYYKLITLHKNYQFNILSQYEEVFKTLNFQLLKRNVEQSQADLRLLEEQFSENNEQMGTIILEIMHQYQNFAQHLSLIGSLKNHGLRERHWEIIIQVTGMDEFRNEAMTLSEVLNQKVIGKEMQLKKISLIASKQLEFQKTLNVLKKKWRDTKLILEDISASENGEGIKVIKNMDAIRQKMESDMIEVQKILTSSFVKFLENQIRFWKNTVLQKVYEFIQFWEKSQKSFILIRQFFTNRKNKQKNQETFLLYKNLQKQWRNMVTQIESQPAILDTLQMKILENKEYLQQNIETIEKDIFKYFQECRRNYPKLFLLSDEKMLKLSMTCDDFRTAIKDCLPEVKEVEQNENQQITSLKFINYQIKFDTPISLLNNDQEVHFDELIRDVENKLKKKLQQALEDPSDKCHILQIKVLKQRLAFTSKVEKSLTQNTIQNLHKQQRQNLQENRKKNQLEKTYANECFLAQKFHELEKLSELEKEEVKSCTSFIWIRNIRYYDYGNRVNVEIANYQTNYGFDSLPMVFLNRCDVSNRVFVNLSSGLADQMGIALRSNGDCDFLWKFWGEACGRTVLQVQCWNGLGEKNIAKTLQMVGSGLWLVLKHFQRLSPPVLSVLEQGIQTMWISYRTHIPSLPLGSFYRNTHINLFLTFSNHSPSLAPIIHEHYRSIHYVPPSFSKIIHFFLYCYSFNPEINISFLLNMLNQLQYLSDQGISPLINKMTFLQKIFKYAQQNRHKKMEGVEEKEDESFLCQCMVQLLKKQVPKEKVPEILEDMESLGIVNQGQDSDEELSEVDGVYKLFDEENLCSIGEQVEILQQMIHILHHHTSLIIASTHLSGKSTLIKLLEKAPSSLISISIQTIVPLAYTMKELYGSETDKNEGYIFRMAEATHDGKECTAIHFDSELKGDWMFPLIPLMRGEKLIVKPVGQILPLPVPIKLIFETSSIQQLEPSQLYETGIVSLNEEIDEQYILSKTLTEVFGEDSSVMQFVNNVYQSTIEPILQFYHSCFYYKDKSQRKAAAIIATPNLGKAMVLRSFLIFFSILLNEEVAEGLQSVKLTTGQYYTCLSFALIWTVGILIPEESRKTYCRHFKYVINRGNKFSHKNYMDLQLPKDQLQLYDIWYDGECSWKQWKQLKYQSNGEELLIGEYIAASYIIEKYFHANKPLFLFGKSSNSKNYIFTKVMERIGEEKFTKNLVVSRKNMGKEELQEQLLILLESEKYSKKIKGFPNGKNNIFYVCDMNLPLFDEQPCYKNGSILEFVRQFYSINGYYLHDKPELYELKNCQYYGTITSCRHYPNRLLRYLNPFIMWKPEQREDTILFSIIKKSSLSLDQQQEMVRCTSNFHHVLERELRANEEFKFIEFFFKDVMKVITGLVRLIEGEESLNRNVESTRSLYKRWVFMTKRVYGSKILNPNNKQILFYFINNVLMEQKRLRYRSICLPSNCFYLSFESNDYLYSEYSLEALQKKILLHLQENAKISDFYLCEIVKHSGKEFLKMVVNMLNNFQFESNILLLINKQRHKMKSVVKIVCWMLGIVFCNSFGNNSLSSWINNISEAIKEEDLSGKNKPMMFLLSDGSEENHEILDIVLTYARLNIFKPWSKAQELIEIDDGRKSPSLRSISELPKFHLIQGSGFSKMHQIKQFNFVLNYTDYPHHIFSLYDNLLSECSINMMENVVFQSKFNRSRKFSIELSSDDVQQNDLIEAKERKVQMVMNQLYPEESLFIHNSIKLSFHQIYCLLEKRIQKLCQEKLQIVLQIQEQHEKINKASENYKQFARGKNKYLAALVEEKKQIEEEIKMDQLRYEREKKKEHDLEAKIKKIEIETLEYKMVYNSIFQEHEDQLRAVKKSLAEIMESKATSITAYEHKYFIEAVFALIPFPIPDPKHKKQEYMKEMQKKTWVENVKKLFKKIDLLLGDFNKIPERNLHKSLQHTQKLKKILGQSSKTNRVMPQFTFFLSYLHLVHVLLHKQINNKPFLQNYSKNIHDIEKYSGLLHKRRTNKNILQFCEYFQNLQKRKEKIKQQAAEQEEQISKIEKTIEILSYMRGKQSFINQLIEMEHPQSTYKQLKEKTEDIAFSLSIFYRYEFILPPNFKQLSLITHIKKHLSENSKKNKKEENKMDINITQLDQEKLGMLQSTLGKQKKWDYIEGVRKDLYLLHFYIGYVLIKKHSHEADFLLDVFPEVEMISVDSDLPLSQISNSTCPILLDCSEQVDLKLLFEGIPDPQCLVLIYKTAFQTDDKLQYPYMDRIFFHTPYDIVSERFSIVCKKIEQEGWVKFINESSSNERIRSKRKSIKIEATKEEKQLISNIKDKYLVLDIKWQKLEVQTEQQRCEFQSDLIEVIDDLTPKKCMDKKKSESIKEQSEEVEAEVTSVAIKKSIAILTKLYLAFQALYPELVELEGFEKKAAYIMDGYLNRRRRISITVENYICKGIIEQFMGIGSELDLQVVNALIKYENRLPVLEWHQYARCCLTEAKKLKIQQKYDYNKLVFELKELSKSLANLGILYWKDLHEKLSQNIPESFEKCVETYIENPRLYHADQVISELQLNTNNRIHKLWIVILLGKIAGKEMVRRYIEEMEGEAGNRKNLYSCRGESCYGQGYLECYRDLDHVISINQHKKYLVVEENGHKGYSELLFIAQKKQLQIVFLTEHELNVELKEYSKPEEKRNTDKCQLLKLLRDTHIVIISERYVTVETMKKLIKTLNHLEEELFMNHEVKWTESKARFVFLSRNSSQLLNKIWKSTYIHTLSANQCNYFAFNQQSYSKRLQNTLKSHLGFGKNIDQMMKEGKALVKEVLKIGQEHFSDRRNNDQMFYTLMKVVEKLRKAQKKKENNHSYNLAVDIHNLIEGSCEDDHQPIIHEYWKIKMDIFEQPPPFNDEGWISDETKEEFIPQFGEVIHDLCLKEYIQGCVSIDQQVINKQDCIHRIAYQAIRKLALDQGEHLSNYHFDLVLRHQPTATPIAYIQLNHKIISRSLPSKQVHLVIRNREQQNQQSLPLNSFVMAGDGLHPLRIPGRDDDTLVEMIFIL